MLQPEDQGEPNPSEDLVPKSWLSKHKHSFNFVTQAESNGSAETLGDDQQSALLYFRREIKRKSLTTVLVVLEDFGDVAGVDEAEELSERRRWHSAEGSGTLDPPPHPPYRGEAAVCVCVTDTYSQQDLQS